ncbi:MAG: acyl carrier protein [Longimicrobiales bacterium]
MLDKTEITKRIRSFVLENFAYMRPDFDLSGDDSLMATGIVDSMGVMEVIDFLETEFGVVVADSDITESNIGSLNAITQYVLARQGAMTRQAV